MFDDIKNFSPPYLLRNKHLQTIYPALFRSVPVNYERERVELPDGDFLDIDWSIHKKQNHKLLFLSHGFEGDSDTSYIRAKTRQFDEGGWDCCAINYRGCSGEPNRKIYSYNAAKTDDVAFVLDKIIATEQYDTIVMAGVSMGGMLTVKYLGERGNEVHPSIKAAVVFSFPADIGDTARHLDTTQNFVYRRRFVLSLMQKLKAKRKLYEEAGFDVEKISKLIYLEDLDNQITAPMYGYKNADEYYEDASAKNYIESIKRPVLMVNAEDDPFLPPGSHPVKEAAANPDFHLVVTKYGGHVGFWDHKKFYMEEWTYNYITKHIQL